MNEFFAKEFYYNTIGDWAISLAIIVGTLVAAKLLYWIFGKIVKKITAKSKTRLDDIIVDMIEEPIVLIATIIGVWFAIGRLSFPDGILDWIDKVYWVIIALTITWLLARLIDAIIREYIVPLTQKTEGDLDDQIVPIIRKAIRAAIWILGIIIALNNAGYNVGALLAGLGIGGLALAMAAKDTVANIFGGITIFTDKPFTINDVQAVIRRAVERARLIKENKDYQENLEKKVEDQTQELVKLYTGTLQAMILALDLRESETGYHSYRVTEYAITLGRHMNLSEPELSVLAKGALLHDIGKIGVPDQILLKPGKLTDEEWEVMRKHAEHGYGMLNKIEFLEESAEIVFAHHEHFDGTGYPNGLSGHDIPLGARIFSVIDAMDAMTSKRVYREEIPFEEAIERIKEVSGTQFDPEIVDVFVKIEPAVWEEIKNNVDSSGSTFLKGLLFELSKYKF